jgi:hypothetical protein
MQLVCGELLQQLCIILGGMMKNAKICLPTEGQCETMMKMSPHGKLIGWADAL